MEIKEKTNEKAPEKIVNKTTETLIKELETLSDKSLYDLFCFFYKLNHIYGQMIDNETFEEFLKAFTSNPFRPPENEKLRKELIDNMVNYSRDHMNLLTVALLLKRKFTIDELVQNYYSNVDAFGFSPNAHIISIKTKFAKVIPKISAILAFSRHNYSTERNFSLF